MRPLYVFAAGLILPALAAAAPARIADPHMIEQYRSRRADLRKSLPDGVTVLFGRTEDREEDLRTGFFQESNFYYLTGWQEPGAILLLAPLPEDSKAPGYSARAKLPREILFLPERDLEQEKWTGRKLSPADPSAREMTGFDTVVPADKFESELLTVLEAYARIYALPDQPAAARLRQLAPLREIANAAPAIATLRMQKSPRGDRAHPARDRRHARGSPRRLEARRSRPVRIPDRRRHAGRLRRSGLRAERLRTHRGLGSEFRLPALFAQLAPHGCAAKYC